MKRGRKSQSGIVTIVLLILLVIGLIVIFYNSYLNLIKEQSKSISPDVFSVNLKVQEVNIPDSGGVEIKIKRGVGGPDIEKIIIIITDINGKTHPINKDISSDPFSELETKLFKLTENELIENNITLPINKVSIIPAFKDKLGLEVAGPIIKALNNSEETLPSFPKGLVSYWRFENNLVDDAGNNNGVIFGNTAFVNGKNGKGIKVDGSGDYVEMPASNDFSLIDGTISIWVYPVKFSTNIDDVLVKGSVSWATNDYNVYFWAGRFFGTIANGTDSLAYIGPNTGPVSLNQWYHVVFSWDTTNDISEMYLNGELKSSVSTKIIPRSDVTTLTIGRNNNYDGHYFNGTIDDVMIFNRALSESEIQSIYNNQK